ncbi:MAG: hypothetical protein JRN29_02360 [Nitrososphaerota archaeon]|nr:hypothetical protein [Nitrososphaerota archaeon]
MGPSEAVPLIIDRNAIVGHAAVVDLMAVLLPLSFVLLYLRVRGWDVPFTPFGIFASLFAKEGKPGFAARSRALLSATAQDILFLKRAGRRCEEPLHTWGRGLVMWGALGSVAATLLAALTDPAAVPMALTDPVRLLGDLSQAALASGAAILILRRLSNGARRRATDIHTWSLQCLLLYVGLSGVAVDALSQGGSFLAMEAMYISQLASISALLLYAPFSELAFLVWKGSLLVQKSLLDEAGPPG